MTLASFDRLCIAARHGGLVALVAVACGTDNATDPTTTTSTTDDDPTTESGPTTTEPDPTTTTTPDPDSSTTVDPDSSTSVASTETTTTESSSQGSSESGEMGICGDGVLSPDEDCEGEEYNVTCDSLGYTAGVGTCNAECELDTSACYICGNGLIEQAEGCDGPLGALITCQSEGFSQGDVVCDEKTCVLDTSGCTLCGDDEIAGPEVCDGSDLGGMTCAGLGFDDGDLGCNADCSYDFASCSGGQYIQDFEGGALPGEFDTSGDALWVVDMTFPITGSWSAHSGNIDDSESSVLTLATTYAIAGTVEFRHVESTEDGYDYLEFWIDGVMQDEWSGVTAEITENYPVAAGNHTFEWRYTKDGSLDEGSDQVGIDDIVLFGGVPS